MLKDFLDLLQCLNEYKVKYLVIGGYAVSHYGEPRYTKDIDIFVLADLANSKKLVEALKKFGAPCDNLSPNDFEKLGTLFVFGIPPGRVDIINKVKGVRFDSAYKKKVKIHTLGIDVNYISLEDLLKTKRAAGRPQDLADIENLKSRKKG